MKLQRSELRIRAGMDLTSRIEVEVGELHRFFQAWFNGAVPKTAEQFARVATVWPDWFTLVAPSNEVTSSSAILDITWQQYGAFPKLRIQIENLRVSVHESLPVGVALYEEWHVDEHETEARLCSATFVESPHTPNGVSWLHIHESPLASSVQDTGEGGPTGTT